MSDYEGENEVVFVINFDFFSYDTCDATSFYQLGLTLSIFWIS